MIKNLFYAGIALLIISIAIFLYVGSQQANIISQVAGKVTLYNFTVPADNYSHVQITLQNSAYLIALLKLSGKANVYLFNGSGYAAWHGDMAGTAPATGLSYAKSLEGSGTILIFNNVTIASTPETGTPALYNSINQTAFLPPGPYYFVVDNTNGSLSSGSTVAVNASYPQPLTNNVLSVISSKEGNLVYLGIAFFLTFVGGIILLIYGYTRKPEGEELPASYPGKSLKGKDDISKEYIDQLYKGIDRAKRERKRRRPE